MPYSYKTVSPYYSDVKYPDSCCSPTPKPHRPSYQSDGHLRGCGVRPSDLRLEEESDAQPLDLSLRPKSYEPVAKRPRLDHGYLEQGDYPRAYPCGSGSNLTSRSSPYAHYSAGVYRSPRHASSPSGPHESPYTQRHSPSPAYYPGSFTAGDYHIPRSSPSVLSSSPSPYALAPSSNNVQSTGSDVYSLGSYGDDSQRPLIHNYGPCFKDADYQEGPRTIAEKAPFQGSEAGLRFIYRTCEPDSINGKQPSTGHLAGKNKEGSELSRLLAPGRAPEARNSPNLEYRSTTPSVKISSCSAQLDQVSKTFFQTKDGHQIQSLTNQTPEVTSSLVQCSASMQSQPGSALGSPSATPPGGAVDSKKETAPKIISKKSLLLERTAGLYHTVNSRRDGESVAKLLEKAADSAAVAPAEEEEGKGPQKISLLDFWISKILMERCEEAPRKPCGVDYVRRTADGQRKIRISLVDLIELQVEHSLKA